MKKYYLLIVIITCLASCGQVQMKTPENAMSQFEQFKAKEKFFEDMSSF